MHRPILPLLCLLLAGCVPALGPLPVAKTPADLESAASLAAPAAAWPAAAWWKGYGDPQLDALIEEARRGSPDVAAAMARVRVADALAQQSGAALAPTLDATGSAGLSKQSYNNGIPPDFVPKGWNDRGDVSLSAGFDLDLWGRNRAALAAATSEAEAARVDAEQAILILSASVAQAYAELARLYAGRDVAERTVAVRQASFGLARDRVLIGLDNRGVSKLAESRLAAARGALVAQDEAIALTRNRLAALVGAGPDRGMGLKRPLGRRLSAFGLPENLAIALIGRRPDIVAARLRAGAAASRMKYAIADFYPNINLSAVIGLQSLGLGQLIDSGSTMGSIGPAISLPLFDGGQRAGRYRQSRGTYDLAVADYDGTLVAALHEVADAAASIRALAPQRQEAATALAAAEEAQEIARLRYEGSLSPYLDVLAAEDDVLERRRAAADLDARAFTLDIALIRALGGGYVASSH